MALSRPIAACLLFVFLTLFGVARSLRAQVPPSFNFVAEHYDISATIDTGGQSISATAKVDFRPLQASSNLRVELHPNLEIREIKGSDGRPLTFQRDSENHLFVLVSLPSQVGAGSKVTLTFVYGGILANAENSPIPGLRAAFINKDGAYLLLPARWFPLTNFPANRYTGTFRINVPDSLAVAGTGKAANPTPTAGGRLVYAF